MPIGVVFAALDENYIAQLNSLIAQWNADVAAGLITNANASGALRVTAVSGAIGQAQLEAEGSPLGYGAGLRALSKTSVGGTAVEMGKMVWDGESTWNTTASTQDSMASVYTAVDGVSTLRLRIGSAGHVEPGADNVQNFGSASRGWKELFCDNGTINLSDARWKTPVRPYTAEEMRAAKLLAAEIGVFQFLAAVEQKGDAARLHIGMTVQRAIEVITSCGIDPMRYGFICHDEWEEIPAVEEAPAVLDEQGNVITPARRAQAAQPGGDKYSFRPTEVLWFIMGGMHQRLADLEARLAA